MAAIKLCWSLWEQVVCIDVISLLLFLTDQTWMATAEEGSVNDTSNARERTLTRKDLGVAALWNLRSKAVLRLQEFSEFGTHSMCGNSSRVWRSSWVFTAIIQNSANVLRLQEFSEFNTHSMCGNSSRVWRSSWVFTAIIQNSANMLRTRVVNILTMNLFMGIVMTL